MASRAYSNQQFTMNRMAVTLTAKCVGAAAANPTGFVGIGVTAITYVSTGKYQIQLADKYAGLLCPKFTVMDSTGTKHYSITVTSETVSSTGLIVFEVYQAVSATAPTRANLATTDTLFVELNLSNSDQKPRSY